jgi:ribosomal protein S13
MMSKVLNEDTSFSISIKTLMGIGAGMAALISAWFVLQADIEEAKKLPVPPDPEITRMEFDMKDKLVRQTIMSTQEDVTEIKMDIKRIEEKIDDLRN